MISSLVQLVVVAVASGLCRHPLGFGCGTCCHVVYTIQCVFSVYVRALAQHSLFQHLNTLLAIPAFHAISLDTHASRYMIASVLLVAGLFCWLCAYTDDAYFHTKDNFGIAVLPLMIPSLALFAFKARTYLQKPYLSLPNWFLYVKPIFMIELVRQYPCSWADTVLLNCAVFPLSVHFFRSTSSRMPCNVNQMHQVCAFSRSQLSTFPFVYFTNNGSIQLWRPVVCTVCWPEHPARLEDRLHVSGRA